MPRYETPGVYVEEIPLPPPGVTPVATAVPVFIGYTQKAIGEEGEDLTGRTVRIGSLQAYEAWFGGPPVRPWGVRAQRRVDTEGLPAQIEVDWAQAPPTPPEHVLHHGLQLYFANGGGECHIHSLGPYGPAKPEDFIAALAALREVAGPTLLVFPDAVVLADADYGKVVQAALECCQARGHCFALIDVPGGVPGEVDTVAAVDRHFRHHVNPTPPELRRHGAAYFPYLTTTLPLPWHEAMVTLASVDEVRVDAGGRTTRTPVPDAAGRLLDDPVLDLRQRDPVLHAAICRFLDAACVVMPPSPAVAGVYCQMDRQRGVWRAPANVALAQVRAAAVRVTDHDQNELNVDAVAGKSINLIRDFTGNGTRVWGARTLQGNDNEWRYVNVRRLVDFVQASLTPRLDAFCFEPNNADTWLRVQAIITSFLTTLWRQGALAGAKPEHAFFVAVGLGRTMTPADVDAGRMVVEMGLAAVRPAEFLVVRSTWAVAVG